mgnify:CR=1 FL=1
MSQKTRKKVASMQAMEAEDLMEGDEDLHSSVEDLINPTKKQLDPNDNANEANNNIDPLDTLHKPGINPFNFFGSQERAPGLQLHQRTLTWQLQDNYPNRLAHRPEELRMEN